MPKDLGVYKAEMDLWVDDYIFVKKNLLRRTPTDESVVSFVAQSV